VGIGGNTGSIGGGTNPGGGTGIGGGTGVVGGGTGVTPGGRSPVTGSNTGRPSRPGANPTSPQGQLMAEFNSMSKREQEQLRRSCGMVLANPSAFDADMSALCRMMSRMSRR
jgi:hypothetical protein